MAKAVLTDRGLKALKPAPAGKRYDLMDAVVPGLGVRVTDKGQRTFVLVARYPGAANPTRRALGEYGTLTLDGARDKAREWLALIGRGVDPKSVEESRRAAEQAKRDNSFGVVADEFIRRHVSKTRTGRDVEREIRRELIARWKGRPITEITRRDVVRIIDDIVDRGAPYQAHNVLGHIRGLFNWAITRGTYELEHSPCDRLKPKNLIGRKAVRMRVLSDDELRAMWLASKEMNFPFGPMFRMLMLTGQRLGEVSDAGRAEFTINTHTSTKSVERSISGHRA